MHWSTNSTSLQNKSSILGFSCRIQTFSCCNLLFVVVWRSGCDLKVRVWPEGHKCPMSGSWRVCRSCSLSAERKRSAKLIRRPACPGTTSQPTAGCRGRRQPAWSQQTKQLTYYFSSSTEPDYLHFCSCFLQISGKIFQLRLFPHKKQNLNVYFILYINLYMCVKHINKLT